MDGLIEPLWVETRRTCWAYSPGGHLAELERATAGLRFADRFDVTFAGGRNGGAEDRAAVSRNRAIDLDDEIPF